MPRKASLVQRVDFPVSGENVCEADKRGLGGGRASARSEGLLSDTVQSPSQKSKIFASPLYTRGPFSGPMWSSAPTIRYGGANSFGLLSMAGHAII